MTSKYFKNSTPKKPAPPREMETIQTEYMQACSKLGNLEYQKRAIDVEIESTLQAMSSLNLEAAQANATSDNATNKEGATDGSTQAAE